MYVFSAVCETNLSLRIIHKLIPLLCESQKPAKSTFKNMVTDATQMIVN